MFTDYLFSQNVILTIWPFLLGQKRTSTMSAIFHKFPSSCRASLERGNPDQRLPSRGLWHQVHGRHLGVLEDGERSFKIRGLHPGVDEADPRAASGERTAQAGNWRCWTPSKLAHWIMVTARFSRLEYQHFAAHNSKVNEHQNTKLPS